MNRYRVVVTIERLKDSDKWVNPASGKVEDHAVPQADDAGEVVAHIWRTVPWRTIAKFGSGPGVDANSLPDAMPGIIEKVNESFGKVQEVMGIADQLATEEEAFERGG